MDIVSYAVTGLLAYLCGSLPTGFLMGKARGIDLRAHGSGNIGATNALRILGKPAGICVLLVDALKGWVAVDCVSRLVALWFNASVPLDHLRIDAGVAAILGHNYTCWLKFKGGKGIATSAGVLTALVPWALLIILSIWIVLSALTRFVSIGSIAASFTLPFATWFTTRNLGLTVVTGAMGALAIYKHRGNIQRLLAGTEPRVGARSGEAAK